MNLQLPLARNSDPDTSHQAADTVKNPNGTAHRVAQFVATHPGLTTGEVCDALGLQGGWKRISDAQRKGLIRYGDPRKYAGTGKMQQTCWPVEKERK